jgi:LysM repeat protein
MTRKFSSLILILFFIGTIFLGLGSASQLAKAAQEDVRLRQAATTEVTEVSPVITSTPRPDGTIVHEVQYGQTLYDIALAYGVTIEYLKGLNYLSNSNIYVGQKLVIRPASTLTPVGSTTATFTNTPKPTSTKKPTSTPKPTRTPTPNLPTEALATPTPTSQPGIFSTWLDQSGTDPILIGIFGIGLAGIALMVIGIVIRKRA